MKKTLLLVVLFALSGYLGFSQSDKFWSANNASRTTITTDKAVARISFPKEFKLFNLNSEALRQQLFSITGRQAQRHSTVISLPNAAGQLESFEVFEASNFEPALQERFPEIRAFSGRGITDRAATLKLSISPQGVQTMLFRTERANEFIEAYSQDRTVYAVFTSQRDKGQLPWTCSTQDQEMFAGMNGQITQRGNGIESSAGELKTMRLAQSCNGEYSNYFGAFNASQVGLVLAAFNATMTRCNGVYEKDLALHLNLIANTADVIFYDPATDPYTTLNAWNGQLQSTLNSVIGAANYDIGHMFGASGGGGNAGCIGCVCGTLKGSGITSPADGIPQGDNFDIDYVVHEVGHQLGANHTFSQSTEGSGVNKEVGSGITIMGYAGIVAGLNAAAHSIDIFHQASIEQIQNNLATKTCPVTTNITANNATPVVAPVPNFTIPFSTPFALTGSATDANAADVLTYCWEQNDNAVSGSSTGANSVASPTKTTGPNFLSFVPTVSPTRTFPRLQSILNGANTTSGTLFAGNNINIEALSSIGRTLNFRLTVRDNAPYSSTAPVKVGQTAYTDMQVIVSSAAGPFAVTVPNTNVSWPGSSAQTVTWSVNGTTGAPINCANVRILLSTDGGFTFPTVLAASTANDGSEVVNIPSTPSTTARIKVESIGNIFFDISNTNFTITVPVDGFAFTAGATATAACPSPNTVAASLATTVTGTFTTPIVLTATAGVPAGTTVTFAPNPLTPGSSTFVTLNNANTLANGTYNVTVQGVAGTSTQTTTVSFVISAGTAPTITAGANQPQNASVCAGATANFAVTATGAPVVSYQWQLNTGTGFNNIAGATAATYTTAATTTAMNGYIYRVIVTGQCGATTSASATLTVNSAPAITTQPTTQVVCAGSNASFTVAATGAGLTYQWQLNTGSGFANVAGATAATYTVNAVTLAQNGHQYQVIVSGTCGSPVTSAAATLTVGNSAAITGQPTAQVVCVGANPVNFTVTATGSSLTYQWQVNTGTGFTNIAGATSPTYNAGPATAAMNGYQYRVNVFSCTPTPITSNTVTLTVNVLAAITVQPTNSVVCAGSVSGFSVTAVGTGISYQWQVSTTGCGGTFANIPGATAATLNLPAVTAGQNGYAYQVVITNSCNTVTSGCATLTVNTPIVVTTQPANASVCLPTTTASFNVAVTGTAPTYQWQQSTDGGATWTNVTGATGATLNLTGLTAAMNGYQYRVAISGTCTASFNSSVATLAVNSPVAITQQPASKSICDGASTTFTVAATGSTITYQWQVSTNGGPFVNVSNGAPYSGATTSTLTVTNAGTVLNGSVYRVVVSGVPCGSVNSNTATLTVNALPNVVLVAAEYANLTPYTPSALYSTVSPATGTYTYVWRRDNNIVTGANGFSLPVNVDGFGLYDVTVTDQNGCSRTSNKVTIKDSVDNLLFIYPNPSEGIFQVRYYAASTTEYSLNVYDSKGSRVWSRKYPVNNRYEQMLVDLGRNASGTYTVDIRDKNGMRLAGGKVLIKR
ncbi:MAG: T9SS type A sorting domain-containing protein [Chitinophagaceae bacterium]|nr:MAG: T9SS type A sorting domain-containing protein [Chitinophagaceae bacterium]